MKLSLLVTLAGAILMAMAHETSGYGRVTIGNQPEGMSLATVRSILKGGGGHLNATVRTLTIPKLPTITSAVVLPTITAIHNQSTYSFAMSTGTGASSGVAGTVVSLYSNSTIASSTNASSTVASPTIATSTIAISSTVAPPGPTLSISLVEPSLTATAVIPTGFKNPSVSSAGDISPTLDSSSSTAPTDIASSTSYLSRTTHTYTRTRTLTLTVSLQHTTTETTETQLSILTPSVSTSVCECGPVTVTVTLPSTPSPTLSSAANATQTVTGGAESTQVSSTAQDNCSPSLSGFIGVTISDSSVLYDSPCTASSSTTAPPSAPTDTASGSNTYLPPSQSLTYLPVGTGNSTVAGTATVMPAPLFTGGAAVREIELGLLVGLLALAPFV